MVTSAHELFHQEGPWRHFQVVGSTNSFHVVEAGSKTDPLVLFLHGFPQFWYTWRAYLTALPTHGFRVVAVDMRGYGGSDQPPRGYDPKSLAHDVQSIIRCLGSSSTIVVGHDWGGFAAWAAAKRHPELIKAIAVINSPHPDVLLSKFLKNKKGRKLFWFLMQMQFSRIARFRLSSDDAADLEKLLLEWNNQEWPDATLSAIYRQAFLNRNTASRSIEYHRWVAKSLLRAEGRAFFRQMSKPINQDVLAIGVDDNPLVDAAMMATSAKFVLGEFEFKSFATGGHHIHERRSESVIPVLTSWLIKALNR
jgi:pimeloyl-ACP methyl ester carboxylesterase